MIIYLDLDGVCTNFIKSCIKAHNLSYTDTVEKWKRDYLGVFSAFKVFGIDNSQFWKAIEKEGESFWSDMEAYSWFKPLYENLTQVGDVVFLTSPSQSPKSHSGKIKWIQKQFNQNFKDYIITPRKELLASPNSVLIDDCPKNIERFKNAGGQVILFPQFWNSTEDITDKISYVMDSLKARTPL